jgi:putative ABC transport system permease protein
MRVNVDGDTVQADRAPWVQRTSTAVNFFEAYDAPIVSGRAFTDADLAAGRHVAIVDETFVRLVLGGGDAVGRQIRNLAADTPGPWTEIVGVARDLTTAGNKNTYDAVVYEPVRPEAMAPLRMAVRLNGDANAAMARLRAIGIAADPALRLDDFKTMDQLSAVDRVAIEFFLRILGGIGVVAVILATAGIYALMSFTVARRTPEIGIRLALGANPRRIVAATFSRALAQVSAGVLLGIVPAAAIVASLAPEVSGGAGGRAAAVVCATAALFMLAVTALACFAPARRALRIQPVDTLKST